VRIYGRDSCSRESTCPLIHIINMSTESFAAARIYSIYSACTLPVPGPVLRHGTCREALMQRCRCTCAHLSGGPDARPSDTCRRHAHVALLLKTPTVWASMVYPRCGHPWGQVETRCGHPWGQVETRCGHPWGQVETRQQPLGEPVYYWATQLGWPSNTLGRSVPANNRDSSDTEGVLRFFKYDCLDND
jgi:hypothetical protein